MPRRKLAEDPQALLGAVAPVALVVLNGTGDVLYRNPAALALAEQVRQTRGPQILTAFAEEAGRLVRDNVAFPVTKMVAAPRVAAPPLDSMAARPLGGRGLAARHACHRASMLTHTASARAAASRAISISTGRRASTPTWRRPTTSPGLRSPRRSSRASHCA